MHRATVARVEAARVESVSLTATRARRLALALGASISLAALVLQLIGVSPRSIWDHARSMGVGTFTIAALGWVLLVCTQSLRWHMLAVGAARVRWPESLAMRLVGNVANTILPARGGDVVRVELLSRIGAVPRAKAVGVELTDVWVDKVGWLPALLFVCAFGAPPSWVLRAAPFCVALPFVAYGLWLASSRLRGRWGWVEAVASGMSRDWRRTALVALLIAPLPWMLETAVIVAASRVAGLPIDMTQAFAMLTALNLALVVPMPGNIGTTEASATAALVAFGVPLDGAAAFAVVYHLGQLVPIVALGLGAVVVLAARGETRPDVAQ
jgi:uncharacterized membrane protein YbhN (UPF0104 family)